MELEESQVHSPRDFHRLRIITTEGRVRTGCLTCRARKVKCDEQFPSCEKCIRLKKQCIYRRPGQRRLQNPMPAKANPEGTEGHEDQASLSQGLEIAQPRTENGVDRIHEQFSPLHGSFNFNLLEEVGEAQLDQTSPTGDLHITLPLTGKEDCLIQEHPSSFQRTFRFGISDELETSHTLALPDLHPDVDSLVSVKASGSSNYDKTNDLNREDTDLASAKFDRTSRVIYLTLAIDWVAASEVPTQSSFSYFIEEVDIPIISSFDQLNWKRIKTYISQLALQEPSVARAILPVQALHRAQVDRLPMTHATFVYQAAIAGFKSISETDTVDFQTVLVIAFLLCLAEFIRPNEDTSTSNLLEGSFVTRLEAYLLNGIQSPVFLRIGAWLQLLNTAAKRGGSSDLLPNPVSTLLYDHIQQIPSLSVLDYDTHPENTLYDIISAPLFTFHLETQKISNGVANVTHYRRSRITPSDQAEVSEILSSLKNKLYSLWEARPGPLRLQPSELREHFHHTISSPLIALAGICLAAYFAEIIAIGRILGDPLFASPEAKDAMKQIRLLVEGEWNSSSGDEVNPGYLRPMFIYALESFEEDDTQWAVDHLRKIKNPMSRSSFFASFIDLHGEAQRSQRRRVTMKYFCLQTFGVPLPYM